MTSKYSEFRKTKQNIIEKSPNKMKQLNKQFNLEAIDEMMQQLTTSRPQPVTSLARIRRGVRQSCCQDLQNESQKNSETNQTCDVTTNVDSQSVSQIQIKKLPIITKLSARRHYTQHQIASRGSDIEDEFGVVDNFSSEINEYLLDGIQQPIEVNNNVSEEDRQKLVLRLQGIQKKIKLKPMNTNEYNKIAQKLNKLETLLQQI